LTSGRATEHSSSRIHSIAKVRVDLPGVNVGLIELTSGFDDRQPQWSPSGRWIVYSSNGTNINIVNLFVKPADGGPRQQVTRSSGLDGATGWSWYGKTFAFESAPYDPDIRGVTHIWTIAAPPGTS
jgi:Tol biopolymer transport system component